MECKVKDNLIKIQERQVKNSYVSTLVDIYLASSNAFLEVCEMYQLLPDELLDILDNPSLVDISFLDELVGLGLNKLMSEGKIKNNTDRKLELLK